MHTQLCAHMLVLCQNIKHSIPHLPTTARLASLRAFEDRYLQTELLRTQMTYSMVQPPAVTKPNVTPYLPEHSTLTFSAELEWAEVVPAPLQFADHNFPAPTVKGYMVGVFEFESKNAAEAYTEIPPDLPNADILLAIPQKPTFEVPLPGGLAGYMRLPPEPKADHGKMVTKPICKIENLWAGSYFRFCAYAVHEAGLSPHGALSEAVTTPAILPDGFSETTSRGQYLQPMLPHKGIAMEPRPVLEVPIKDFFYLRPTRPLQVSTEFQIRTGNGQMKSILAADLGSLEDKIAVPKSTAADPYSSRLPVVGSKVRLKGTSGGSSGTVARVIHDVFPNGGPACTCQGDRAFVLADNLFGLGVEPLRPEEPKAGPDLPLKDFHDQATGVGLLYEMFTGVVEVDLARAESMPETHYVDDFELLNRKREDIWRPILSEYLPEDLRDRKVDGQAAEESSAHGDHDLTLGALGLTPVERLTGADDTTQSLAMLRVRAALFEYTQECHAFGRYQCVGVDIHPWFCLDIQIWLHAHVCAGLFVCLTYTYARVLTQVHVQAHFCIHVYRNTRTHTTYAEAPALTLTYTHSRSYACTHNYRPLFVNQ